MATIGLVVNPKAGGATGAEQIAKTLASHSLNVEVYEAFDPAEAARNAVREGARIVIAAGGDGTISGVASVIAGSDVILAVLPVGTLNHFAKELGIPVNVEEAASIIAQGKTDLVDVGEVNGRTFINNSSLGLYPTMVILRESQEKRGRSRWMALFWAIIITLRRMPMLHVQLTTDHGQIRRKTPMIFVGNNQYEVEGIRTGTRACLNEGCLSVSIANAHSALGLIRLSLLALFKRLSGVEEFEVFTTKGVVVETKRSMVRVSLDGETMLMTSPLHYRIRPVCLRVIVP